PTTAGTTRSSSSTATRPITCSRSSTCRRSTAAGSSSRPMPSTTSSSRRRKRASKSKSSTLSKVEEEDPKGRCAPLRNASRRPYGDSGVVLRSYIPFLQPSPDGLLREAEAAGNFACPKTVGGEAFDRQLALLRRAFDQPRRHPHPRRPERDHQHAEVEVDLGAAV